MRKQDFTDDSPGHLEPIPEGVDAFVPDPLPPPAVNFSNHAALIDNASLALGGLRQALTNSPSPELVTNSFFRREAVRSSKIEGTHTQLGQLLLFEVGETEQQFNDAEDAEQVERNLKAIHRGLELVDKLPLYGRVFREIHAVLFEGANKLIKRPGEYRESSTRIGGPVAGSVKESFAAARFIPPPHGRIQQCMKDLEDFINLPAKHGGLPLIVQLAFVHYQFETIHPFCDGNGRIGRLAISLLLKSRGAFDIPILCLSAYMDEHRDEYTDLMLGVSQRGVWGSWIEFFAKGIQAQADEDAKKCQRLIALRDEYLACCDTHRIPMVVADNLCTFPVTTISKVADATGKTFPTAQKFVEQLEAGGWLKEVTKRSTNRVYLAQPIIDALEPPTASA